MGQLQGEQAKLEQEEFLRKVEQDENEELYNEMTEACDKLAKGITEQLVSYEQVSETDAIETLLYEAKYGYLGELETDGEKVYETLRNVYS